MKSEPFLPEAYSHFFSSLTRRSAQTNWLRRQLERCLSVNNHLGQRYPDSVVAFIEANPKYTEKWGNYFATPVEAYFNGRVAEDWQNLRRKLPRVATSILDIGSGIGGVALHLKRKYAEASITLVDQNERFQGDKVYSVISAARDLFSSQSMLSETTLFLDVAQVREVSLKRYDLVISLRALGYMFPFESYRSFLLGHLAFGGTMILDIGSWKSSELAENPTLNDRFKYDPGSQEKVLEQLSSEFGPVEIIRHGADSIRVRVKRTTQPTN